MVEGTYGEHLQAALRSFTMVWCCGGKRGSKLVYYHTGHNAAICAAALLTHVLHICCISCTCAASCCVLVAGGCVCTAHTCWLRHALCRRLRWCSISMCSCGGSMRRLRTASTARYGEQHGMLASQDLREAGESGRPRGPAAGDAPKGCPMCQEGDMEGGDMPARRHSRQQYRLPAFSTQLYARRLVLQAGQQH